MFQTNVIHLTSYKNIGSLSESQAEDENMVIEILHKTTTYNDHYIDMEFSFHHSLLTCFHQDYSCSHQNYRALVSHDG